MPIRDRPSFAQMESIVALLCYSDEHGKLVANLIDLAQLEGDFRDIAIRVIDYWRQYDKPPKLHLSDLFADILEDPENPRKAESYQRIFYSMAALNDGGLNAQYIINDLQSFSRWQTLKGAVLQAADILQRPLTPDNMDAAERSMLDVAKAKHARFDRGMRLDDDLDPFLDYLEKHHAEFTTGVEPLDRRGIVPARGEVYLMLGGKGRGKSWLEVQVGKRAIRSGKRALHISLENSDMQTRLRYYQALFAASKHSSERVDITRFRIDQHGKVVGLLRDTAEPEFNFSRPASAELRAELESHIEEFGARISNLIIKRFPNRSLTFEMLEAYLDSLEQVDGFVPDILLLDYPKLMKMRSNDPRHWRQDLRDNTERLRQQAIERNHALVIVDQLNREGHKAGQARSHHVGEDWSQTHTADAVISHSATEAEAERGLCRLFVDHARGEKDKFTVLVSQCFELGQFVIHSALMPSNYYEAIQPRSERAEAVQSESQEDDDGYDQEDDDRGLIGEEEHG